MSYGYRSGSRALAGLALRMVLTVLGLSLLGMVFYELLISIAGIAAITLVGVVLLRWRIFRWRGW